MLRASSPLYVANVKSCAAVARCKVQAARCNPHAAGHLLQTGGTPRTVAEAGHRMKLIVELPGTLCEVAGDTLRRRRWNR